MTRDKIREFIKRAETANNRLESTTAIECLIEVVKILNKEQPCKICAERRSCGVGELCPDCKEKKRLKNHPE